MNSDERVFLSLGCNLGDCRRNLQRAIERIDSLGETAVVASSPFIETEPWGDTDQPGFLNAVIEIRTGYAPHELLTALKQIELELGRVPAYRWGPRAIDIDIIVYGRRHVDTDDLTIPHTHCLERDFVMEPLTQIAPDVAVDLRNGVWVSQ